MGKYNTCTHSKDCISQFLISPLEAGIPDFRRIVEFYEYKAPMIDCVHSEGRNYTNESQQAALKQMLAESKMTKNAKFLKRIQKNSMELMALESDCLCLKCPRMLCRIGQGETEFACVLRHLRNGFAHGRTYIKRTKNQTYIMIEDFDTSHRCSARMIITKAILDRWRKLITEGNILQKV